jgi:hypothetical protein
MPILIQRLNELLATGLTLDAAVTAVAREKQLSSIGRQKLLAAYRASNRASSSLISFEI